jgi:ankyrin repeat protein
MEQKADMSPMEQLAAAVKANDLASAEQTLERHPELKSRLNEPRPEFSFGATLLLGALQRRSKEMIDLLLRAGADINARSHWWAGGFGVLDDDHGLASFLIERGATVDAHAAARLGMLDKLKELISVNPELVHARGGDGQTPLHFAVSVEIADFLLNHGAKIDALDVDHESTPAQYMVRGRQEVARHLVARGCRTDILMAAALGDVELVRKHLDADPACIRMSVSDQYFPKRNLHAGGTIYIWTLGQHKTAHVVAREFGHEDVFRLLMDCSPEELKLAQACELGDEAIFNALLARYPDLTQRFTDEDRRKLAHAAQNNNTQAVRLMLAAGWPVSVTGRHGGTPLHWAAFHGNAEMAEIILRYNPPLELQDIDYDSTPIGWAIHGSENGWHRETGNYSATVEAILRAGAKVPEKVRGTDAVKDVLRRFGAKE